MVISRVNSVPLVTHDPYFSIWSSHDTLYGGDTTHWTGKRMPMRGRLYIDGKPYVFMGEPGLIPIIEQKELDITPTRSTYTFANDRVVLTVSFRSPLLMDDLIVMSRPCTYMDIRVDKIDKEAQVSVVIDILSGCVGEKTHQIIGGHHQEEAYQYVYMQSAHGTPLSQSGDHTTMDWGAFYLASENKAIKMDVDYASMTLESVMNFDTEEEVNLVLAYDDLVSINYFGEYKRGYWTTQEGTIQQAIAHSLADYAMINKRCHDVDEEIMNRATETAGEGYALLTALSYRQSIAAHKVIEHDGEIIFLSKENDSNGCIGTVDVSYPSVPLYLLYNPELVKGMLRPIFSFANCPIWTFDYAPHDVGRYPYATGQVYALNSDYRDKGFVHENGYIFPNYYAFPKNHNVYDERYQMPVEECGNMLIMTAVVCEETKDYDFAKPYMPLLEKWANYLDIHALDPGEQLCTDDFAGHLSHNANLSVKGILGIYSYGKLLEHVDGLEVALPWFEKAKSMAKAWEKKAVVGDHTRLVFNREDGWSLKYNLIWDQYFGSHLFDNKIFEQEITFYKKQLGEYGVPLDSRASYTKSDWIAWCASFADKKEDRQALLNPVNRFATTSTSRVPFSDWYETDKGTYCSFIARSVQGGIFMPIFIIKGLEKE